jgi:hypothetical protein
MSASNAMAQPAQKKADYSLPWGLRPGIAPNLVRSDTAFAFQERGRSIASTLTGGYRLFGPDAGLYGRVAWTHLDPDGRSFSAALSNPLVFGLWTPQVAPGIRIPVFAGVTAPIGEGGGSSANPSTYAAASSGIYSRSAMDNALFVVNYTTVTGGAGVAFIRSGFTAQAEVTILQLFRVRGDAVDKDEARTNFTGGLHLGYRVLDPLTVSVELRYQRWLSTPLAVAADASRREQLTFAVGLRTNIPLSATMLIRPGVSYAHPLDDPMAAQGYRILQLDVPLVF